MPPLALQQTTQELAATTLREMSGVELMNRVDTKFVISESVLLSLLQAVRDDYRILTIDQTRLFSYRTLYFDTPRQSMYRRHHNGRDHRHKVRKRIYVDTGKSFLEVKEKTSGSRCAKERILLSELETGLDGTQRGWLRDKVPYAPEELVPRQWNQFSRLTLVENDKSERVTIDTGLSWRAAPGVHCVRAGRLLELGSHCVVEVKQSGFRRSSPILTQLKSQGCRARSFSKYCIGEALLHPWLKRNRFKQTLRFVGHGVN